MKSFASHPAAAVLLGTTLVGMTQAQNATPRPPDGGSREVLISILIPSLSNAPFSATVNTESVRQLPNGTSITLKNHRAIARDRAGRIFQERRMLVPDDGKHESVLTQIEISDPVAHVLYICAPKEKVCQVESFIPPSFAPPRIMTEKGAPPRAPSLQSLGKQFIEGLETLGARETAVIEAGAIGNDSPLEVRREYWYSPQLGVNLISRLEDPRVGNQNFEVTDISLSDPDAQLFKVGRDMKVIDLREPTRSSPSR